MSQITKKQLREKVVAVLKKQGYEVSDHGFSLKDNTRDTKRDAHSLAKKERIIKSEKFILNNIDLISANMVNGADLDIEKIEPKIIEVQEGSKYEKIFRWWNLVWWSLPYEHAYGRQMRFVIWDKYHKAPIGLIGLQSPILSWSVRDNNLGINKKDRDYWVNQSMSAQRLGALPPYNYILGGKLVASLMTTDIVRKKFEKKYSGKKTILKNRKLPSKLLFITTTGAYGKSSVYNRLKFNGDVISKFIGYTKGSGSFHIPNTLFEDFVKYLEKRDYNIKRGYGNGPSRKMRLINQAMDSLGIANGSSHGIHRAVYLFPLAKNLEDIIQKNKKPIWINRTINEITEYWRNRWIIPRLSQRENYKDFSIDHFINETRIEVESFCKEMNKIKTKKK